MDSLFNYLFGNTAQGLTAEFLARIIVFCVLLLIVEMIINIGKRVG